MKVIDDKKEQGKVVNFDLLLVIELLYMIFLGVLYHQDFV